MLLNSGRIAQMRFGDKVIDRGEESCHYACEWRVRVRAREGARVAQQEMLEVHQSPVRETCLLKTHDTSKNSHSVRPACHYSFFLNVVYLLTNKIFFFLHKLKFQQNFWQWDFCQFLNQLVIFYDFERFY